MMNAIKLRYEQYQIRALLWDFHALVAHRVADARADMTPAEYTSACDALDKMQQIARDPQKYLSRDATMADWTQRGHQYATEHGLGLENIDIAMSIVDSPLKLVLKSVAPAFKKAPDLRRHYEDACEYIFDWEYNKKAKQDQASKDILTRLAPIQKVIEQKKNYYSLGGTRTLEHKLETMVDSIHRFWTRIKQR